MVHSLSGKFQPVPFRTAAGKMNTDEVSAQAKRIPDYEPNKYDTYDGVDVAEVTVDTETCRIHVKRDVYKRQNLERHFRRAWGWTSLVRPPSRNL